MLYADVAEGCILFVEINEAEAEFDIEEFDVGVRDTDGEPVLETSAVDEPV